ncbi:MAG: hypothetical protein IJX77_03565 [Ruminococcus sp.]|nr:hypothetical protein [Ruminococcus sp.]
MIFNPLYYCPAEANRLKNGEKFSKLSATEQTELNRAVFEKKLAEYDSTSKKLYDEHDKIYGVHVGLLLVIFLIAGVLVYLLFTDRFRALYLTVPVPIIAAAIVTSVISEKRKKKYLEYLLGDYQPVCTELDENDLREAGFLGRLTVGNMEYFKLGNVPHSVIHGIDLSDRRQKCKSYLFSSCVCAYCGEQINNEDILIDSSKGNAICPVCKAPMIVPCYKEIPDETVEKLVRYWTTVEQISCQFLRR